MEPVETVVAVAFGVLAAAFLATISALFVICYRRLSTNHSSLFQISEYSPDSILVSGGSSSVDDQSWSEFELDDVKLAPQIRRILNNTQWVDDVTGLIPHSLGILKLSHQLTERLLVPALAGQKERLHEMIQLSRRVSPRIDDVASAMYPPLDPRLLEARCSALVMALHLLVWHAQPTTSKAMQGFIFENLSNMEKHLEILRDAAMSHEANVQRVFRDENVAVESQMME